MNAQTLKRQALRGTESLPAYSRGPQVEYTIKELCGVIGTEQLIEMCQKANITIGRQTREQAIDSLIAYSLK